jgi:hypothetical protein
MNEEDKKHLQPGYIELDTEDPHIGYMYLDTGMGPIRCKVILYHLDEETKEKKNYGN